MILPRPRLLAASLSAGALLAAASPPPAASDPALGADLSFVPRLRSQGVTYRADGVASGPLAIFRDAGYSIVRLRLWHTPDEPWHGIDSTVAFAREVRAAGFELMLDLHYSDTWADPSQQSIPAAWEWESFPDIADSVRAYAGGVVRRFRDAGAAPASVQIGNEIDGGFLWDEGRVDWPGSACDTPERWVRLTTLLRAAAAGVRDGAPAGEAPRVVLHLALGGDNARCRWFLDHAFAAGVDPDVIGVSFYPWWHGALADLEANLDDLAARYAREVQVVEAAYPWTLEGQGPTANFVGEEAQLRPGFPATPEGQRDWLRALYDVVRAVPGGRGGALLLWEPAFLAVRGGPDNPVENLALFDFEGNALPGLRFTTPPGGAARRGGAGRP